MSHTFKDGQKYWRDIRGNPKTIEHGDLSDHFLQSKVRINGPINTQAGASKAD